MYNPEHNEIVKVFFKVKLNPRVDYTYFKVINKDNYFYYLSYINKEDIICIPIYDQGYYIHISSGHHCVNDIQNSIPNDYYNHIISEFNNYLKSVIDDYSAINTDIHIYKIKGFALIHKVTLKEKIMMSI